MVFLEEGPVISMTREHSYSSLIRPLLHGARDREKTNNEKLRYYLANLSSLDEVRQLAEEVRAYYHRLVILINNARVFVREWAISRDGHELTFAVNYLAPFLLTHLLVPLLRRSAPARATTTSLRRAKAR